MFNFDLQLFGGLFGGGGGSQTVETPTINNTAPISSPVQTTSGTNNEKADKKKRWGADARGRRSTITGAGTSAGVLESAGGIAKTLLGEMPQRKTLGGA